MGWENVFHCEWNPFGQKVLNHYWPKAITYHDITKTDFTIHRGAIDIITGGFPCQPYSSAGKRLGKEDERHLWPQMLRAIREIQPTWVVGENVRGLTNWNGGLVFDEVQTELEAQGYEVTPFLLPACAVNAPHRRDRIWFVAFNSKSKRNTKVGRIWEGEDNDTFGIREENINASNSDLLRRDKCINYNEVNTSQGGLDAFSNIDKGDVNGNASDSSGIKLQGCKFNGSFKSKRTFKKQSGQFSRSIFSSWEKFPISAPICNGDDGISDRLDTITFSKWRQESIKAGGNAIVPQVVHQIFKAIEQYNELNKQLSI
jgi:DNA (cytosine-5)-methyltransferase 1